MSYGVLWSFSVTTINVERAIRIALIVFFHILLVYYSLTIRMRQIVLYRLLL